MRQMLPDKGGNKIVSMVVSIAQVISQLNTIGFGCLHQRFGQELIHISIGRSLKQICVKNTSSSQNLYYYILPDPPADAALFHSCTAQSTA